MPELEVETITHFDELLRNRPEGINYEILRKDLKELAANNFISWSLHNNIASCTYNYSSTYNKIKNTSKIIRRNTICMSRMTN